MRRIAIIVSLLISVIRVPTHAAEPVVGTYSIVAFDPATGDLGVGVQSKFFNVGAVVPWAKAGVGAIATQARTNVSYGPEGLKLLAAGKAPAEVLKILGKPDPLRESRQVGIVDAKGRSASFTGKRCFAWAGHLTGKNFTVQGNILASEAVVKEMAAAFEAARKEPRSELADWLVAALVAAEKAGGDRRGRQSSALLVVRADAGFGGFGDRYMDLRVEDHPTPVKELSRLAELHKRVFRLRHLRKPKRDEGKVKEEK